MKVETKFISPKMAEALLSTSNVNRPVSFSRVLTLTEEMSLGKWQTNGQTIVVAENGKLLDGQHRLFAIIEHGKPVEMTIVTGAPNDAFETIDTGRSRSGADIASIAGVKDAWLSVAAAGLIWRMWHSTAHGYPVPPNLNLRVIERYPAIRKWSGHVKNYRGNLLPAGSFLTALVYFEDIAGQPAMAERFFENLTQGVELAKGSPVLALRNRMITYRAENGRRDAFAVWGAVVRTINALEAGEAIQKLSIGSGGGTTIPRPALWAQHVKEPPKSKSLDDLKSSLKHGAGFRRQFLEAVDEIRSRAV